jgi:hypothetical protein
VLTQPLIHAIAVIVVNLGGVGDLYVQVHGVVVVTGVVIVVGVVVGGIGNAGGLLVLCCWWVCWCCLGPCLTFRARHPFPMGRTSCPYTCLC